MKKFLFFLLFLIIPFTSAISTTLLQNYEPGETIIIEIQGNVLEPIQKSDVIFRRNHVAVAVDYDVKRILDKYYLYAQAPMNQNNYTLFINNIATTVNGQNQKINYNQSFQVIGNITDYSINPGFIISSQDFEIVLKSNKDTSQTINTDFPAESSIQIQPGTNTIKFSISQLQSGVHLAQFGKYTVPIQIIKNTEVNSNNSLEVFPKVIRENLEINKTKSYNISITNTGSSSLDKVYFTYNKDLFILDKELISLEPNSSINISIELKEKSNSILETIFIAKDSEILSNITFSIFFTNNQSEITNSSNQAYYCQELSGKFCSASEICSGESVQSLDGLCCLGQCNVEEESSSSWIIYTLILAALLVIIVVYLKYRKTKLPKPKGLPINSVLKKSI